MLVAGDRREGRDADHICGGWERGWNSGYLSPRWVRVDPPIALPIMKKEVLISAK